MRALHATGVAIAALLATPPLAAQAPPAPAQPAPEQGQPPPQPYPYPYPYPPQPYPYPYAYPPQAQPAVKEPPREIKYREGESTPPGYTYVERTRSGMVLAGALVLGIPYTLGLYAAAAADFENGSGWLVVPAAGPFLMIGARDSKCDDRDGDAGDALECAGDVYLTMLLVLDGLAQTAGAALLLIGVTSPKRLWVRQDLAVSVGPTRVGSGYGLGAVGSF
jgi:hypothetical protein